MHVYVQHAQVWHTHSSLLSTSGNVALTICNTACIVHTHGHPPTHPWTPTPSVLLPVHHMGAGGHGDVSATTTWCRHEPRGHPLLLLLLPTCPQHCCHHCACQHQHLPCCRPGEGYCSGWASQQAPHVLAPVPLLCHRHCLLSLQSPPCGGWVQQPTPPPHLPRLPRHPRCTHPDRGREDGLRWSHKAHSGAGLCVCPADPPPCMTWLDDLSLCPG